MKRKIEEEIKFYDPKSAYYEFSNFYEAPVRISLDPNEEPVTFRTSEHAYQAAKFDNLEYREVIRNSKTPNQARIYGYRRQVVGTSGEQT
jgi:predicted NAD-dependent protein-ADP-ribosyltransferase YbiA (DUF1768 family)